MPDTELARIIERGSLETLLLAIAKLCRAYALADRFAHDDKVGGRAWDKAASLIDRAIIQLPQYPHISAFYPPAKYAAPLLHRDDDLQTLLDKDEIITGIVQDDNETRP